MYSRASTTSLANEVTNLQFTPGTVFVALRCWWKVITPVALTCALAGAGIVHFLHKPTYTADAWLLIKEKPDVVLREVDQGPQRFIQNQLEIIRSPRLLSPLASNPEIIATPELRQEQDIVRVLANRIKISPRGDSDIYVLSFTSQSPEKAELIVREVVSAYFAFNRQLDSQHQSQILELLQDQREARYQEMNQLRDKVRSLSMELTGVDPFRATRSAEEQSKAHSSMAALQADIVRYEVAQDIMAAHIKAEEERLADEDSLSPEERERITTQIEGHPTFLSMQNRIDQLRRKLAQFERTGKNLDQNSSVRQTQAELEAETSAQDALATQLTEGLSAEAKKSRETSHYDKLKELRAEFAIGAARLKILNEKFEQRMGTAKQFAGDSLGLEFSRAKLDQLTKIHDEISARILAVTTEQRAPDRVMAFKEASRPLRPDESVPWKKTLPVSAVAFLFPFAIVMLWEHCFRRVSCRNQVETLQQIRVVAEVTALPWKTRSLSQRHSRQREALLFEESVDSLRTYLSLTDSLQDAWVLAITSAISGEGKSTLCAQLAVSVERATGRPTLLIDGDMRSPSLHEYFDLPLDAGLAEVLSKQCPLESAICCTNRENLHVMSAGRLTTSPHRLLNDGTFGELLKECRVKYRFIIVDTPPILPASEALVMGRSADAAILCMRRDYTRIDQVQEAYQRMTDAGIKISGAVLNGIPVSHYARKYGSYPFVRVLETAGVPTS